MDAYLAVVSKRDERRYAGRPIPVDVARRILEAGRVAGSSRNRQLRTFVVVADRARVERLAQTVYAPDNVLGAALVVAIAVRPVGPAEFDAGRAAQNMMLAAWDEGVVSCPNGMPDAEAAAGALGLDEGVLPLNIPSFGYPKRDLAPDSKTAGEWSAEANRKSLGDIVKRA